MSPTPSSKCSSPRAASSGRRADADRGADRGTRLSSAPGAGLVLAYHRVCDLPSDPAGLCVTPQRFAEQMEVLARSCHAVPLGEMVERAAHGDLGPRTVAVTFDDGYADNLHEARPILARHGVPATVFVTTGALGGEREFWWDELERILFSPGRLPQVLLLRIGAADHRWVLGAGAEPLGAPPRPGAPWSGPAEARHRLYRSLWQLLFSLPDARRGAALDQLLAWAGAVREVRGTHRRLTAEEVRLLCGDGLVGIGAHTHTHPQLGRLAPRRQLWEITASRDLLREICGHAVRLFSYPHGSYTARTTQLLRGAGFAAACTMEHALVRAGVDPFRIPRHMAWNWDAEELARHLAGWFSV